MLLLRAGSQYWHNNSSKNPGDMNYKVLAKKARYFKHDEKGVATIAVNGGFKRD